MKTKINGLILGIVLFINGCGGAPGASGPAGATGATGTQGVAGVSGVSKFTSGITCAGTISGLTGAAGTALNGLVVNYKAYVTSSGDVFADANVANSTTAIGNAAFYSSAQVGATTASVFFVDDFATPNAGFWEISSNRSTGIANAVYTDNSLGAQSPVTITFLSNSCTIQSF